LTKKTSLERVQLPVKPLFELTPPSRASPGESWLPGPAPLQGSTQTTPLMGFSTLQHIRERRSTLRGLCLPTTFRPRGLVTPSAGYSLRTPAGFVSHRRRSWVFLPFEAFPFHKVARHLPRLAAPTYRFIPRCSRSVDDRVSITPSRTARFRFLGFVPCGSPWRPQLPLSIAIAGCFPGVFPS
jgi:hypothetical protein